MKLLCKKLMWCSDPGLGVHADVAGAGSIPAVLAVL
jgi:hypothetical protein